MKYGFGKNRIPYGGINYPAEMPGARLPWETADQLPGGVPVPFIMIQVPVIFFQRPAPFRTALQTRPVVITDLILTDQIFFLSETILLLRLIPGYPETAESIGFWPTKEIFPAVQLRPPGASLTAATYLC